jgi:hypothetical protein
MKKFSFVLAIVVLAVMAGGSLAFAQPRKLPRGSYRASCSNIRFDGRTLSATCLNKRGRPVRTSIANPNRCRRDDANINGTLMCQ